MPILASGVQLADSQWLGAKNVQAKDLRDGTQPE
jgi:hypothetical protein